LLILCTIYLRRRWRRRQTEMTTSQPRASPFTLPSHILPQKLNFPWKPSTVVPVPAPALSSWTIEPLSLPPSHPASGYVNGSGRPVTASVPSAPPSSQQAQEDIVEPPVTGPPRRVSYPNPASQSTSSRLSRHPTSPSSASSSSYGVVIYVHNLQDPWILPFVSESLLDSLQKVLQNSELWSTHRSTRNFPVIPRQYSFQRIYSILPILLGA